MQITLGQQYNVGEKPTVVLYIYINRHAGIIVDHSTRNTHTSYRISQTLINIQTGVSKKFNGNNSNIPSALSIGVCMDV